MMALGAPEGQNPGRPKAWPGLEALPVGLSTFCCPGKASPLLACLCVCPQSELCSLDTPFSPPSRLLIQDLSPSKAEVEATLPIITLSSGFFPHKM